MLTEIFLGDENINLIKNLIVNYLESKIHITQKEFDTIKFNETVNKIIRHIIQNSSEENLSQYNTIEEKNCFS